MADQNLNDMAGVEQLGGKLGFLISTMPLSDETKRSLVKSALLMNEQELVEFISLLEAKYSDFKTQNLDQSLQEDLMKIKQKYDKEKQKVADKAISDLSDLESELDNLA